LLDARLLLQHSLDVSREQLLASVIKLTQPQQDHYRRLIEKRAARQPVSQLIGKREFWGMSFKVTAATLDPRPDSETLIEAVLGSVDGGRWTVNGKKNVPLTTRHSPLTILDLGTGTGCLLLALLKELPGARGVGVDVSDEALAVARENAAKLGLAERAEFIASNWGEKAEGTFDIIVANPPYIKTAAIAGLAPEVAKYEPKLALDGGEDGLDCYRAIAAQLPNLLADNGLAAVEIGEGQEKEVRKIVARGSWLVIRVKKDLADIPRCILLEKLFTNHEPRTTSHD